MPSAAAKSNWSSVFDLREARVAQALAHRRVAAGRDLDGEDLVQVILERPLLLARLACERLELASSAGHLELPRLLTDEVGDDDVATHCDTSEQRVVVGGSTGGDLDADEARWQLLDGDLGRCSRACAHCELERLAAR